MTLKTQKIEWKSSYKMNKDQEIFKENKLKLF